MSGTYPNITGAYPVRFPYTHKLLIPCDVKSFFSGKQQRYAIAGLLNSFRWTYSRITFADLDSIYTFWKAQKGAFDSTWDIPLVDPSTMSARSYAALSFNSDTFNYTESPAQWYALSLDVAQTVGEAVAVAPSATFPTINGGVVVQVPFGTAPAYRTLKNDLDSGKRVSWAAYAFPLTTWALNYPAITDAEVQSLVNFYLANAGAVNPFTFTDPNTGDDHTACHFGAQGLTLTRISRNANSLSFSIEEFLA